MDYSFVSETYVEPDTSKTALTSKGRWTEGLSHSKMHFIVLKSTCGDQNMLQLSLNRKKDGGDAEFQSHELCQTAPGGTAPIPLQLAPNTPCCSSSL